MPSLSCGFLGVELFGFGFLSGHLADCVYLADVSILAVGRNLQSGWLGPGFGSVDTATTTSMDDVVDLGETSQSPSNQAQTDDETCLGSDFFGQQTPNCSLPSVPRGGGRGRGRTANGRSSSAPSRSVAAPLHKARGPNWTESEMLVLIEQKRIEWDGRHNSNQPSLARFVYGSTAWKIVLAGCMGVVGFRERDADQITNKWDGLIKDYKKIKEYVEGTGSANWWGMNREEKKVLSKSRRLPLEFSESMYKEMEAFVGKRQIFGRAAAMVDSDRSTQPAARPLGRSPSATCSASATRAASPATSSATLLESPRAKTPGDDTPGSTSRKRKASGSDGLVEWVKDFNSDYLARVDAQDTDRRAWRGEVFAFDSAREARLAMQEAQSMNMDEKLYSLEVERTKNLGNMTSALLMLASSMDALTRSCTIPFSAAFIPCVGHLWLLAMWSAFCTRTR